MHCFRSKEKPRCWTAFFLEFQLTKAVVTSCPDFGTQSSIMSLSTNHEAKVSRRFQWPFSLEVFYKTEGYRAGPPIVRKAVEKPEVDSGKHVRRRAFRWPFSLDAFYGTELYRVPMGMKDEKPLISILRSKYGIEIDEKNTTVCFQRMLPSRAL